MFRTAIVHGQLTAHGGQVPEVLCLGMGPRLGFKFADPDSLAIAQLRESSSAVQPFSACQIEPRRAPSDDTSLVVERATNRRGLVIWMESPQLDSTGAAVHIGYFEHGLSAADWKCAVRRTPSGWIVNACRMLGIS